MKPQLSIIIPCYNAEKYISRCLDSIITQSIGLSNIQLIIVDDASDDNSLNILRSYEERYPEQILVITYDHNFGPGGARNIGLTYAEADYIGYCDIDDWLDPDMYKELLCKTVIRSETNTNNNQYDIVYCKYTREQDPPIIVNRYDKEYSFKCINGFYWGKDEICDVGDNGTFIRSCCTGIYKRSLLVDNDIQFAEGLIHEDIYWMELVSLYASNAYIVDLPLYHYLANPNSITTSFNDTRIFDRLEIETMLINEYQKRGAYDVFKGNIATEFINRFYINTLYLLFTRFDKCPNLYNTMYEIIMSLFPDWEQYINIYNQDKNIQFLLLILKSKESLSDYELEAIKTQFLLLSNNT